WLSSCCPGDNCTVDNDARIALTGAIGFGGGVVVIAGTGSVAFGRKEEGAEARAGGWGPIIGDEGSGYGIARAGLAAIMRAHDGRGPATKMTEILKERHDMKPEDLPPFVYATTTQTGDIARFGKLVVEAAPDRGAAAAASPERGGRGGAIGAVGRRLHMVQSAFRVAYVGGAFRAGDRLRAPMREPVRAEAPKAEIGPPRHTPVEGAAQMATRASKTPRPSRSTA